MASQMYRDTIGGDVIKMGKLDYMLYYTFAPENDFNLNDIINK